MGGLRHRAGRVAGVTKAVLAAVLMGGTLTVGLSFALAGQATAFSATPQWFLASTGAPASSLTCGPGTTRPWRRRQAAAAPPSP